VLELSGKKARMTDYESCMECGACQLNCEYGAVDVTKGTGCLFAIIKEDILKITPKGTGCCGAAGSSKGSCC
jgi:Fe-S-cluster-containing hydrogenase component 2